jgi:phage terminase large subunit
MGRRVTEVVIPYAPRTLQRVLHQQADTHRFGAVVCHRRFGKTVFAVNHLEKRALTCKRPRPRVGHIFPTYTQGKSAAWDYAKYYAQNIPGRKINESELRIDFPNGGRYRIFGADNPDSLRGQYFDDVVFDEYGLMPPKIFSEVVRPALSDREGGALFLGTPNGKNQFYDAKQRALSDDSGLWFFAEFKASETGILGDSELDKARSEMSEDEYLQEYECSFEASVKGAIFAREILAARKDGRITRVPYDPALLVDTDWDLGVNDWTTIWFSQVLYTGEVHLIDYYQNNGFGLNHYAQYLKSKPYAYGTHWAPHDIKQRELGSGNTLLQTAGSLGITFRVMELIQNAVAERIHSAKMMFPKCWFDAEKCAQGVEALQHYRWAEQKTQTPTSEPLPVHDWASHGADSFGQLAFRNQTPKRRPADDLRKAQRDYDPYDRPVSGFQRGGMVRGR